MKIISTIVLTILTFSVSGNDGVYFSGGGVIYPIKESKISLHKEILSFLIRDKICQVDIQFEFNNPEKTERKLLIGFQAPAAVGDVPFELNNGNHISNFRIMAGGQLLSYKAMAAECEGCALKDPKAINFSESETGIFVYLFEVIFKPGINRISHSYSFPASSGVMLDQSYNYILTTGSKWQGEAIKNLTVQIDLGTNKYFYVADIFGKNSNWSIIGSGKVLPNRQIENTGTDSCRMIRILSGRLQIDVNDFKPRSNIEFGIINPDFFSLSKIRDWTDSTSFEQPFYTLSLKDFEFKNLGKEKLRLLRNVIYAQKGYQFKSREMQDYFSKFEWYIPDPNLTIEQIVLTDEEKKFLEEISKKEKE